jgi:predicted nucleic-acid-binding protein
VRGLDTNVLVRFLLADDLRQYAAAKAAIAHAARVGEPLVVSLLVLLETEWVLRSSVGLGKNEVIEILKKLLEAGDVAFEYELVVEQALSAFEHTNADFADCLMIAHYQRLGCSSMLTFDGKAAKLPGAELLIA